MAFVKFSEEQLQKANHINLEEFLREQGESLEKSGREWRWSRNTSVTVRGNRWYKHKDARGGYPIQFLKEFYDMNFVDAVKTLLEIDNQVIHDEEVTRKENVEFVIPQRNSDLRRTYAYLMKERFIDKDIITAFVKKKLIYEDKEYRNIVFAGYDENGVMKHAHRKGTNSRMRYGINQEGSHSDYRFHYDGMSKDLYVFESPIDLLSYLTLHPDDWQKHSYIACCGLSSIPLYHYLDTHKEINHIHLCLDHDIAGEEATSKMICELNEKGYKNLMVEKSLYKDWNEDLKAIHGIEPIMAIENPKYIEYAEVLEDLSQGYLSMQKDNIEFKSLMQSYADMMFQCNEEQIHDNENLKESLELISCKALLLAENVSRSQEEGILLLRNRYRSHRDRGGVKSKLQKIKGCIATLKTDIYVKKKENQLMEADLVNDYLELAEECAMTLSEMKREEQHENMHIKIKPKQEIDMNLSL